MNCQKILSQALDLHVHIGPEIIPRKFTLPELISYEKGKIKGLGIKNHFFPTVAMAQPENQNPLIINSVVLNHYLGGFNADIIKASAELSSTPIIVWFPTLHTKKFMQSQKFEIPKEWIDPKIRSQIKLRLTKNIKPLNIIKKGKIIPEVKKVLYSIKENQAILATGHLTWPESYKLVKFATKKIGLKKIIITHPIYQKINMPIKIQIELAKLGALIEHCYSMYSIDKIPIKKIAQQIKKLGANNCLLSSDVGQTFSPSPSEALTEFIILLKKEGITEDEIKTMLIKNPRRLIF